MSEANVPAGPGGERPGIILYQTEDGRTRIECRLENETIWLTQALIAELFDVTPQNVTLHLKAIYEEGELDEGATCKDSLQVRPEGGRQVSRTLRYYSLPAILAVGYRVRSHRGTQFRQWATARLSEFLVTGFVMDDERLKNPPGKGQKDYFDDLLERIRDIRSSERRFYQKVLDIYATSVDYSPATEMSQRFFATVQNKMHYASHGHTAAEVIHQRADSGKPFMGMTTTRPGGIIRKDDVSIAKNYLNDEELAALNRIVNAYLEFAELAAMNRRPMTMRDAEDDDAVVAADEEGAVGEAMGQHPTNLGLTAKAWITKRVRRGAGDRGFDLSQEFLAEPRLLIVVSDGGVGDVRFRLDADDDAKRRARHERSLD